MVCSERYELDAINRQSTCFKWCQARKVFTRNSSRIFSVSKTSFFSIRVGLSVNGVSSAIFELLGEDFEFLEIYLKCT